MNQLISNLLMQPNLERATITMTDAVVERPNPPIKKLKKAIINAIVYGRTTTANDGDEATIQVLVNDVLDALRPDKVYELIYEGGEGYYSIMHSLDKAVCERFIEQVREYDALYEPLYNAFWAADGDDEELEKAKEKWEENHPLKPWEYEIHGEPGQMDYYLSEDGFKSYAHNLRVNEYTLDKAENK